MSAFLQYLKNGLLIIQIGINNNEQNIPLQLFMLQKTDSK